MRCRVLELFPRDSYNISDLARYCGVSRVAMSNIIHNKCSCSVKIAIRIAKYFSKDGNWSFLVEDLFV